MLFNFKDIRICCENDRLTVENCAIRRVMDISQNYPKTIEIVNCITQQIIAVHSDEFDFNFAGFNLPDRNNAQYKITGINAKTIPATIYEAEHVCLQITMFDSLSAVLFEREIIIYPAFPGMAVRNFITAGVLPNLYWTYRTRLRCKENRTCNGPAFSNVESFKLSSELSSLEAVEFFGRTDNLDVLLQKTKVDTAHANGNLLFATGHSGAGMVLLQESPPSTERRDMEEFDFYFNNNQINSCCWGVSPAEFKLNKRYQSYRNAIMLFSTEHERQNIIHEYLKLRYPERMQDHAVMVNPWGCGHFPSVTSQDFLLREIAAAADCGAECYQIDDSWQQGDSLWSLIGANQHITADFWNISTTRLNGSFDALAAKAKKVGIELALWTAPSGNVDYSDAENYCNMVLKFHQDYSFRFFKVDAMMLRSYEAEENITSIFRKIRNQSNGEVFFNLDVTNGQRAGYFHLLEFGNIFLQNRYVSLSWSIGYHPEKTLRTLWNLTRYTRSQLLQIEVPYPGDLTAETAIKNPTYHVMPDCYTWSYWAAIALFANPLWWFAPSEVPPEKRAEIAAMAKLHKEHRTKIFSGNILPLGNEPDGRQITGFHSRRSNGGMLLFFREYGCSKDYAEIAIELPEKCGFELLHGNAEIQFFDGKLQIALPVAATFALFEYNC